MGVTLLTICCLMRKIILDNFNCLFLSKIIDSILFFRFIGIICLNRIYCLIDLS